MGKVFLVLIPEVEGERGTMMVSTMILAQAYLLGSFPCQHTKQAAANSELKISNLTDCQIRSRWSGISFFFILCINPMYPVVVVASLLPSENRTELYSTCVLRTSYSFMEIPTLSFFYTALSP